MKFVKKVLLTTGLGVLALLVLAVLLYPRVLAPKVDAYFRALLLRALTEQFQREVTVGDVHLTFPNPQLTVSNLEIARFHTLSEGTLLSSRTLNLRISLKSLFARYIIIEDILLDTPTVWIEFDQQGRSNLPDFGGGEPKPEPPQPSRLNLAEFLRRLQFPNIALKDAQVHVVHQPSAVSLDIDRLSTNLAIELRNLSARGRIDAEGGAFDWQQRGPIATALSGTLAFANNTLTLSQMTVQANSTSVTVDGAVTDLLTQPHLNLTVNASVELNEVDDFLQLMQTPEEQLRGRVTVAGRVTGPLDDPAAEARVVCAEGRAWKLDFAQVDTNVRYVENRLLIDSLSVDILGGHADGSGALTFVPEFGYQAALTVAQLDAAEANRFTEDVYLPISGRLNGSVNASSATVDFEDLIVEAVLALDTVNAYGVEVPQGELQVEIRDTTLYVKDLLATVFQGTASGDLRMNLASEPDYKADLDLNNVELAEIMRLIPQPPKISGRVSGKVLADGATYDLEDVALQADLNIRNLIAYGITSRQTAAQARIRNSALWIDNLTTDIFDGLLEAEGQLVLAGNAAPKFAVNAALNNIDSGIMLAQLARQSTDQPAVFAGRISGDISLSGADFTLDAISGRVNLTGEGAAAAAQAGEIPIAMQVTSALTDQVLTLESVQVDSQALQLGVSGTIDLAALNLDVTYDVASEDIAALLNQVLLFLPDLRENSPLAQFSGTIDKLRGTVRGSVRNPEVRAEAHFTNADLVYARVDDVRANLRYDGEALHIDDASARYKTAAIAISDGRIGLAGDAGVSLDLPVTIAAAPLQDYLELVKQDLPIEGDLDAITTTVHGPLTNIRTEVALHVRKGVAWNQSFDSLTGTVALVGDRLTLKDVALKKNGGRIRVDGFLGFDTSFEAAIQATDLDFHDIDASQDVPLQYEGRADIDLKASGTFANPTGTAAIRLKNLVYQQTPIEDVTCDLTMGQQTIQATLVTFRQKFVTTLELRLPDLDYRAELLMDNAAIEQILALAANIEGLTGLISGAITSAGNLNDLNAVSATVKLSRLDLDIFGQKISNAKEIDLLITPERFTVNSLDLRGAELGLFAQGSLDFTGNFDLAVDGAMDLRPFAGLLPPSVGISGLAGRLQLICNVQGTFLQPRIEGIAELQQGHLQLRAYPDPIRNIEGKIAFTPNHIRILGIQGNVGGGSFTATGVMAYTGTGLQDFEIDVSGKQIAVNQAVDALKLTISPHLQISGTPAQPKIAGEVLVQNAVYTKDLDIQNMIANSTKSRRIPVNTAQQSLPLELDVFIRAPKDIQVRNRFAEIDLRADLRVQGTPDLPQLEGRVEILTGMARFGDITYRILSGVLDFSDPLRLNPEMNIRVETTVQDYLIGLGISGPLSEFTLDMQAEPELSQAQITRLLAGASNSGGSGYDFVTRPLQTLVEGELGKAMRLDRFSVDVDPLLSGTEDAETSPSVTLGKRLFGDLLLTFTTTVGGSESSRLVELEYRLSDRLSLTASRNDKGEIDTSFTFKVKLDEN